MNRFPLLLHPIVGAPLAGGPSTPELAAAVSGAGGLGFVAAGYLPASTVGDHIDRVRALTDAPFGVNIFCLSETAVDSERVSGYARRLEPEAARLGAELGEPRFEDDEFAAKLELIVSRRVPIVSFTFGCPSEEVVQELRQSGAAVWVTVTDVPEALSARAAGSDALIAQGVEAGGHRGSFEDVDGSGELPLLVLLRMLARSCPDLPLIAAGGIADGAGVAAVLAAGASAAQIGTALMLSPEAGTSPAHREALTGAAPSAPGAPARPTALTRAFTGRRARGLVNRFMREHEASAPAAYPHVHHLTSPLRRAARARGDAESINLWAGQAYSLAEAVPAAELVQRWSQEAAAALSEASNRLHGGSTGP